MKNIVINIENIDEACHLADDILLEIRMHAYEYDLNTLKKKPKEDIEITKKFYDFKKMSVANDMEIIDVDNLSVADIKEKYLNPYLPLARMLFRGRGDCPHIYIFGEEVDDEFLDNLLCVRFRDLLRIIVIRETATIKKKK